MSQEVKKTIKKDDRKAIPIFFVILFVSMIAGGVIGFCVGMLREGIDVKFADMLNRFIVKALPYGLYGVIAMVAIVVIIACKKSRREFYVWDGEDEEVLNKIEMRLGYALWMVSLHTIFNFFVFSASICTGLLDRVHGDKWMEMIIILGGFILGTAAVTIEQQKLVNLEKEMNPEKSGSVYDVKFQKKWMDSCDEAEKYQIYQCAYKAYKDTNSLCLILWVFCTISGMYFDFGLMPTIIITLVWGTMITSYTLESIHMSKKN